MILKNISVLGKIIGVVAVAGFLLSACAARPGGSGSFMPVLETFSAGRIKADISFLADDLLMGRDTGSDGYRIAANYVAAEYGRLGLVPAGAATGSYFQEVPFQMASLNMDTTRFSAVVDGRQITFRLGDDYYMGGSVRTPKGEATGQLVFAGYGVHAPDQGYDDLEGLDLKGKIALVLSGAPAAFQTEVRAHYASVATKTDALRARGALAMVTVNTISGEKRFSYDRLKGYLGKETFDWVSSKSNENSHSSFVSVTISHDTARVLFSGAEQTFDDILKQAEEGRVRSFPLQTEADLMRNSILSEPVYSPNVLGILEGSDPVLKNEYVLISAHLDHIGVSRNAEGKDKINNGALDNAAGVAVMLEVARAYVQSGVRPRRSLLFAAVTAEEKGLLGAEYFAEHPTVPLHSLVANINLDMPVLLYDFTDVIAFGAERSSLGPITEKAVNRIGLSLSPDPIPEEGVFTRSDHYRFVQKGIPAVFLVTGFSKGAGGQNGGEVFMHFLKHTYHSPADDTTLPINYQAGAKFAYANWLILNAVANAGERPAWNRDDFFGQIFGRQSGSTRPE